MLLLLVDSPAYYVMQGALVVLASPIMVQFHMRRVTQAKLAAHVLACELVLLPSLQDVPLPNEHSSHLLPNELVKETLHFYLLILLLH